MSTHWKIARDYYYSDLLPELGLAGIEEAGYFNDTATEDYDIKKSLNFLCTPFARIYEQVRTAQNPCVLLTTGSFCLIHQGHIDMMISAKSCAEEAGYEVLGGYISPGHDEYINYKVKEQAIPAYVRLKLIQDIILKNNLEDWLMADPWEGLFCKVAVNFTDVVYRLQLYLERQLDKSIPVFFVCGADNARFGLTFLQKGHCIIVGRPSYEERYHIYKDKLKNNARVLWVEGESPISSTLLRSLEDYEHPSKKELHLRINTQKQQEKKVVEVLKPHFAKVHEVTLEQQIEQFQKLAPKDAISMDAFIPTDYNLQISRVFDLFGLSNLGFTNRPGSPYLGKQLENIPEGEYCLFDDDIHTGSTMNYARQLLSKDGKKILAVIAMNLYKKDYSKHTEVLDARDFLLNDVQNGLVVQIKNKTVRAPYVYPYVCPYARASIYQPMEFSKQIWKLNFDYYTSKGTLLKEAPIPIQDLFLLVGFDMNTPLATICLWHLDFLNEIY